MKISTPMISLDARGRLKQAVVFSIWRGLNYVRGYVTPTNPATTRQRAVRALFVAASRAWGSLTSAQRTSWRDYAAANLLTDVFGATFAASGINWYVGLYCRSADMGEDPVDTAPTAPGPGDVSTAAAAAGINNGEIDCTWVDSGDGDIVDLWITPELPDGREPRQGDYVHHSYTTGITATKTIDGLINGGRYGILFRYVQLNGLAGPAVQVVALAKAP